MVADTLRLGFDLDPLCNLFFAFPNKKFRAVWLSGILDSFFFVNNQLEGTCGCLNGPPIPCTDAHRLLFFICTFVFCFLHAKFPSNVGASDIGQLVPVLWKSRWMNGNTFFFVFVDGSVTSFALV